MTQIKDPPIARQFPTTGFVVGDVGNYTYKVPMTVLASSIGSIIGAGTVTSVALSVPPFLTVSGSPITTSGVLGIAYSGTALPVANGGSGATSLTGYLVGNGTSPFSVVASFPSTAITYQLSGTGTVSRTLYSKLSERVTVTDFAGVDKTGATDSTTGILNFIAYCKLHAVEGVWPAGTYSFGVGGTTTDGISYGFMIDWRSSRMKFEGLVNLVYTGAAGYAVVFEGGAVSGNLRNPEFGVGGTPWIRAVGATGAVLSRSAHRGEIRFFCEGALSHSLRIMFAVCTKYFVGSGGNAGVGWYQAPTNGIVVDGRGASEYTSGAIFDNPLIEAVAGDGVVVNNGRNCTFINGTIEACGGRGYVENGGGRNLLIGMDIEANGGADLTLAANGTKVLECVLGTSTSTSVISGSYNVLESTVIQDLTITSAGIDNVLRDVDISAPIVLTDNGVNTVYENVHANTTRSTYPVANKERPNRNKLIGPQDLYNVTRTNPCVVSFFSEALDTGETITFSNMVGCTELNGNSYQTEIITDDNATYLFSAGVIVSSSGFAVAFTSGQYTLTPFLNSWANVGGGIQGAGYCKDANGIVTLSGQITGGLTGLAMFTLPTGYRPLAAHKFMCVNTQVPEIAVVTVAASGVVTAAFATAANAKISLEGVSFRTDS